MPWLRWLFAGLSPHWPKFSPMLVHMVFVVDNVVWGQVFL